MRELLIDVDKPNQYLLEYIKEKIYPSVSVVGGLCSLANKGDRSYLGIAVCDECFSAVNRAIKSATAEVLAVGYRNKYLQSKIKIDNSTLLAKTLLNTMCVFDSNYDTNVIRRKIDGLETIALDGCYNFLIGEIKIKWNEVVALANNYSGMLAEKSVMYEFMSFLLDAIPSLSDSVTVVVSSDNDSYVLMNNRNKLLSKFCTFPKSLDIKEQILFNLVCYNPALVKFCGDIDAMGKDFFEIINELFNVKEYFSH